MWWSVSAACLTCVMIVPGVDADCQFTWTSVGGGVSGRVVAMLEVNAEPGPLAGPSGKALFAAGQFTHAGGAGGAAASNIARWDGVSWFPLAGGVGAEALSLALFDDGNGAGPALYVGGEFTIVSGQAIAYIARWDGHAWSQVGTGINDHVLVMVVHDDGLGGGPALFAGGFFPNAGNGFVANRIAKWDGAEWSPLASGMNGFVRALAVYEDGNAARLIAGGQFTTAGGVTSNYIAQWDGVVWSALGEGMNGPVYALSVYDSGTGPELYAGGVFTVAGGMSAARIARWNGQAWSSVGAGMNNEVHALASLNNAVLPGGSALYAAGLFTTAGSTSASRIAQWDGSQWRRLGAGMGPPFAYTLCAFDGGFGPRVHVGGNFTTTGDGAPAAGICVAEVTGASGDADGDLVVSFEDISTILAFWGAIYPQGYGPGDANFDGFVNTADLIATLANWLQDCRAPK